MGQASEPRDSDFRVVNIEARFLYERSGSLSVDLTDNPDFVAWNSIIGEGSALEAANDLLVTAVIQGPGQHNLETPLSITARNGSGRILATRTIATMLVEERTQRALILYDVGCAGVIRLEARLGASTRTEQIELACGE